MILARLFISAEKPTPAWVIILVPNGGGDDYDCQGSRGHRRNHRAERHPALWSVRKGRGGSWAGRKSPARMPQSAVWGDAIIPRGTERKRTRGKQHTRISSHSARTPNRSRLFLSFQPDSRRPTCLCSESGFLCSFKLKTISSLFTLKRINT